MDAKIDTRTEDLEIGLLLEAIHQKFHYDFRGYSMASVRRRLKLARDRLGLRSYSQLQDHVLNDPAGLNTLLSYLTVQVSEMFRDPGFFRMVREKVIPHLRTYPSLKIWIAGCSSGEELYSFAILFREEGLEEKTIFYATDISAEALKKAESGVFDMDRVPLFSENYQKAGGRTSLSDYYTAAYGGVTFDKTLRSRVLFSDHSLATDAVFGEMQMISCRNVLIYFDRELQNRAIGLFAESLSRKGFLGLGAKESIRFTKHSDEFADFVREDRIYQKKDDA